MGYTTAIKRHGPKHGGDGPIYIFRRVTFADTLALAVLTDTDCDGANAKDVAKGVEGIVGGSSLGVSRDVFI